MTFLVTTPIPAPGMEIIAAAGPVEVLPAPPSSEDLVLHGQILVSLDRSAR